MLALHTPASVKKEEEEVLQVPEQKFPFQILVQTLASQAAPLQPMEVHGGVEFHFQPMEEPPWIK